MKVYTRRIEGHQVLCYNYNVSPTVGFNFHMLCEVGAPWQAEAGRLARALAAKRGCTIGQIELAASPWYVDALIREAA